MEPPNNGRIGDKCFVHYSEVVPSLEVLTCIQLLAGARGLSIVRRLSAFRSVHCRRFHCIHGLVFMYCNSSMDIRSSGKAAG